MDKVSTYLSIVSPLLVMALVIAATVFFAVVPRARRLHFALGFLVFCTMIGQMPELPGQGIAKISIAGSYVLVAFCALSHPGPRLRLPPLTLWWPIMAVVASLFVLYVDNVILALALRLEWFLLVCAALLTVRTITDRKSADLVARAIGFGLMIGLAVSVTALAVQGKKAFHLGRLDPYGANSNQIGVVFAATVPFALYEAMRSRMKIVRWGSVFMSALAATMVVITASRSSVVVTGMCAMPFIFSGIRRSAMLLSFVAVAAVVIIPFVYTPEVKPEQEDIEGAGLGRLGSIDTPRYEIFVRYLDESISKRPFTGLLGENETSFLRDDDIGMHPHDAYLEMMYLGGLLYALPMLCLIVITMTSALYVVRRRKQTGLDPLLITVMFTMLLSMYAHGFVNGSIYYPTSAWGFLHVLLSGVMIATASRMKRAAHAQRNAARRGRFVAVAAVLVALACTACCNKGENKKADGQTAGNGTAQVQPRPDQAGPPDRGGDDGDMDADGDGQRDIDVYTHVEVDTSSATPDLLCAVKLDKPADGPAVRKSAKSLKVPMMIIAYNWIIDVDKDGRFDDKDKARFGKWIDINVPAASNQIVAIDYEKPYWKELRNYRDLPPERLKEITAVYRDVYAFAKAKRPKARWGFFGIPARQYAMHEPWKQRIHDLGELLLRHEDVVFLSIYDQFKGDNNGRDLEAIRTYVELTLAEAGDRPVYAFARGRYAGRQIRDEWMPEEEFKADVDAALDARWQGKKLTGVILWDGPKDRRPQPATTQTLDDLYARQLKQLQDAVRTRRPK